MSTHVAATVAFLLLLAAWNGVVARERRDFRRAMPSWERHRIDGSSLGADGVRLADANGDGLPDIVTGWEEGGVVRICLNPGAARARQPWPSVTVGNVGTSVPGGVEDAVLVDLDGDGALDVVSSCEGTIKTMFVHWAPRDKSQYLNARAWKTQAIPASIDLQKWMFCLPLQVDGRNGVDLVAGGKGENAQIGWFEAPSNPRDLSLWKWHSWREAGWTMSLIAVDMDGDRDLDVLATDRFGRARGCFWLENPGLRALPQANNTNTTTGANTTSANTTSAVAAPAPPVEAMRPWVEHTIRRERGQPLFAHVADVDGDGMQDVLMAASARQAILYRRLSRDGLRWQRIPIPFDSNVGLAKAVSAGDIDGDGKTDLVVSCAHVKRARWGVFWMSSDAPPNAAPLADAPPNIASQNASAKQPLALPGASALRANPPVSSASDMASASAVASASFAAGLRWDEHNISGVEGVKYDLVELRDLDGDGDLDVITCEERSNLGVVWYENPRLQPRTASPSSVRDAFNPTP